MNIKTILLYLSTPVILGACKQNSGTTTHHIRTDSVVAVSHEISIDAAKKYVQNYIDSNTRKLAPLSGDTKHTFRYNTQCIWFSRQELDTLMAILERDKGDGIRFYFAAYDPEYENNTAMPRKFWGKNTLIMASTRPDTLTVGDRTHVYHRDFYNDTAAYSQRSKGFLRGLNLQGNAFNHGEVCPYPPNCNSIGATLIKAEK
nr:hypothetical protein [uncultured Chitinophaga sp.]